MDDLTFLQLEDISSISDEYYANTVDISVHEDESFILANGIISHNSAVGGISSVRTPEIHGALPLTGKILNVNGEARSKVIASAALLDIMNALGLMVGEKAERRYMRYGKIYIATDADPDGANISALLINFFYTYWPELFDPKQDPFVYFFMTPFIIAEKGKQRKYWYSFNVNDFKPEGYKGWEITRAKGLAALLEEHWKDSIDNPVAFPVIDDGQMKESLDLIFNGKRADDRKTWMGI